MSDELTFTFIKFDDGNCRVVCIEDKKVFEIYEGSIRHCLNAQLEVMWGKAVTAEKFRIRAGDKNAKT